MRNTAEVARETDASALEFCLLPCRSKILITSEHMSAVSGFANGWSLSEAVKRTGAGGSMFSGILESGRLLVFRSCRVGSPVEWIPPSECLFGRNFEKDAALRTTEKDSEFVLYPVVHAPNAAQFVEGMALQELVSKFVIGDPEVQFLSQQALEFRPDLKPNYTEQPDPFSNLNPMPLVFDRGMIGGGNSGTDVDRYFSDLVPEIVQRASDALELRFNALLNLLRGRELIGIGDPVRPGDVREILVGLWSHQYFYWDQMRGDLVEISTEGCEDGVSLDFLPRWRAVTVERVGSSPGSSPPTIERPERRWVVLESMSTLEKAVSAAIQAVFPSGLDGIKAKDRDRRIREYLKKEGMSACSDSTIKRALSKLRLTRSDPS